MDNRQLYLQAFAQALDIPVSDVREDMSPENTPAWDSVAQIILVSALEEAFSIEIAPQDILQLASFEDGMGILAKNYGIPF